MILLVKNATKNENLTFHALKNGLVSDENLNNNIQ